MSDHFILYNGCELHDAKKKEKVWENQMWMLVLKIKYEQNNERPRRFRSAWIYTHLARLILYIEDQMFLRSDAL